MKPLKTLVLAIVAALAFAFVSSSVEAKQFKKAKAVPSGTVDVDGDGYFADDKDSAVVDCDDKNPSVHPGAKEVWDNGIDDDCKDGDAETPPLAVLKAFKCNPSNKPAIIALKKEWANCEKDSAHCTVDKTAGKFHTTEGYAFRVKRCGGLREVVDAAESERLEELEARGAGCKKSSVSTTTDCTKRKVRRAHKAKGLPGDVTPTSGDKKPKSHKGKGKSTKAAADTEVKAELAKVKTTADDAKKTAEEASKKADKASKDAEAAAKLVADVDESLDAAESRLDRHDELLGEHRKLIKKNEETIEAEAKERQAEDEKLGKRIDKVDARVSSLTRPIAELYLGMGSLAQSGVPIRGTEPGIARGYVSPMFQIGANLGVEAQFGRLNGFGLVGITAEQSGTVTATGLVWQTGVDMLFRTGDGFVGPHVMYQHHEAGGDILASAATSRGGGAGLTFKAGWFQGRLTVGYEAIGGRGNERTTVDSGLFAGLSIGGAFGL